MSTQKRASDSTFLGEPSGSKRPCLDQNIQEWKGSERGFVPSSCFMLEDGQREIGKVVELLISRWANNLQSSVENMESALKAMQQWISSLENGFRKLLKPVGMLEAKLVQAKELTNKDLVGKSDPYAVLYVRPLRDRMKKSTTINNGLNPVWNEHFEFIIEDASTQHLENCPVSAANYQWCTFSNNFKDEKCSYRMYCDGLNKG